MANQESGKARVYILPEYFPGEYVLLHEKTGWSMSIRVSGSEVAACRTESTVDSIESPDRMIHYFIAAKRSDRPCGHGSYQRIPNVMGSI